MKGGVERLREELVAKPDACHICGIRGWRCGAQASVCSQAVQKSHLYYIAYTGDCGGKTVSCHMSSVPLKTETADGLFLERVSGAMGCAASRMLLVCNSETQLPREPLPPIRLANWWSRACTRFARQCDAHFMLHRKVYYRHGKNHCGNYC